MRRVVLLERESGLLRRASYANQARVHNGYHYPRSILTSIRSRLSYSRFRDQFPDAVDTDFNKVYAIARRVSKINAQQFTSFSGASALTSRHGGARESRSPTSPRSVSA